MAMRTALLSVLLAMPPHAVQADDAPKVDEVFGVLQRPQSLEDRICSFSWPCDQALRVARCESTMNPRAVSRGGHIGLFQLSPGHSVRIGVSPSDLFDADVNMRAAWALWSEQSWRPWSCRP